MRTKLQLSLDQLEVASFETQKPQPQPQPADANVNVLTCMNTNCGRYLCCA
jgi:hypothetical protein